MNGLALPNARHLQAAPNLHCLLVNQTSYRLLLWLRLTCLFLGRYKGKLVAFLSTLILVSLVSDEENNDLLIILAVNSVASCYFYHGQCLRLVYRGR